jgi:hypothetical protein
MTKGPKPKYSSEELISSVNTSLTMADVLRKLGLRPGGGTVTNLKRKLQILGIDTSHMRYVPKGRPRERASFICKECGSTVILANGDVPRVYCSDACLKLGRPKTIRKSCTPEVRTKISLAQICSWADPETRSSRLTLSSLPTSVTKLRASSRKAGQSPILRKIRSVNAKRRWDEDLEFRSAFLAASKVNRQSRALAGEVPAKPTKPYESLKGTILMRSKWETDFALLLDRCGLIWQYEPTHIIMGNQAYTPDFLVSFPFGECYVELHRVLTAKANDPKFAKMSLARSKLTKPLLLLGELEVARIRKQLKEVVVPSDFWYQLLVV